MTTSNPELSVADSSGFWDENAALDGASSDRRFYEIAANCDRLCEINYTLLQGWRAVLGSECFAEMLRVRRPRLGGPHA
jgi:hypothetical protein